MKNSIKLFIIAVLTITVANAQIKNSNKINLHKTINLPKDKVYYNPKQYLDLETIKSGIKSGKKCYNINLTSTAIIPPKYPKMVQAVDAYYMGNRYVKVERDYLRSNGLLLRSDAGFKRYKGNNYEVLIYPNRYNKKEIDQKRIKITWHVIVNGTRSIQTFLLRHVSVQYKPYGILIIGDYNVNGIIVGVSIAITETTCLI